MKRRHLVQSALVVLAALVAGGASAQQFPSKPIKLVVPFAAGGANDLNGRSLQIPLGKALGGNVIVENMPGASTKIAVDYLLKSPPDGHTLLLGATSTFTINRWLYKTLPYDPEKDFEPVTNIGTTLNLLVVSTLVKAASVAELVALAKAAPRGLTYASAGNGTTSHLCVEMLKSAAGVDIVHVPYKGAGDALNDLIAGRVQVMCSNPPAVLAQVRGGRLRPLAVTSPGRQSILPEVPTMQEAGFPSVETLAWSGIFAPAGTPKPVVERLNTEMVKVLRDPGVAERLGAQGVTVVADSPEHFARTIAADALKWQKAVKDSGAKAE